MDSVPDRMVTNGNTLDPTLTPPHLANQRAHELWSSFLFSAFVFTAPKTSPVPHSAGTFRNKPDLFLEPRHCHRNLTRFETAA